MGFNSGFKGLKHDQSDVSNIPTFCSVKYRLVDRWRLFINYSEIIKLQLHVPNFESVGRKCRGDLINDEAIRRQ